MASGLRPRFGSVLFNGAPPRADRLTCWPSSHGNSTGLTFDLDDCFRGSALVDWTGAGGPPRGPEREAVDLALAALIAQHALPKKIVGTAAISPASAKLFRALLTILYDIRASCDETSFRPVPVCAGHRGVAMEQAARGDDRRVLVLMSGGFDSTLAALLLKKAGYEVHGLHVRCNRHVEVVEEAAARAISADLDVPLATVAFGWPDQEAIGRHYSRTFGEFPFYNSIPHGRDLPLAMIAAVVARRLGCGAIAFGHEKESRKKALVYRQRRIFRHDVESARGARLTERLLQSVLPGAPRLFSPLAGMSIYRVRASLLRHAATLGALVQSCFWGRRCERCLKCVSTYAMLRHLEMDHRGYAQNPFADKDDRDMRILAEPDRPTFALAYGPQMHYVMWRMVRDGSVGADDYWLLRFREFVRGRADSEWRRLERFCLELGASREVPADVGRCAESLR